MPISKQVADDATSVIKNLFPGARIQARQRMAYAINKLKDSEHNVTTEELIKTALDQNYKGSSAFEPSQAVGSAAAAALEGEETTSTLSNRPTPSIIEASENLSSISQTVKNTTVPESSVTPTGSNNSGAAAPTPFFSKNTDKILSNMMNILQDIKKTLDSQFSLQKQIFEKERRKEAELNVENKPSLPDENEESLLNPKVLGKKIGMLEREGLEGLIAGIIGALGLASLPLLLIELGDLVKGVSHQLGISTHNVEKGLLEGGPAAAISQRARNAARAAEEAAASASAGSKPGNVPKPVSKPSPVTGQPVGQMTPEELQRLETEQHIVPVQNKPGQFRNTDTGKFVAGKDVESMVEAWRNEAAVSVDNLPSYVKSTMSVVKYLRSISFLAKFLYFLNPIWDLCVAAATGKMDQSEFYTDLAKSITGMAASEFLMWVAAIALGVVGLNLGIIPAFIIGAFAISETSQIVDAFVEYFTTGKTDKLYKLIHNGLTKEIGDLAQLTGTPELAQSLNQAQAADVFSKSQLNELSSMGYTVDKSSGMLQDKEGHYEPNYDASQQLEQKRKDDLKNLEKQKEKSPQSPPIPHDEQQQPRNGRQGNRNIPAQHPGHHPPSEQSPHVGHPNDNLGPTANIHEGTRLSGKTPQEVSTSKNREQFVYDYFKSKGYTDEQAAAAVGNYEYESGGKLDPSIYGGYKHRAFGIVQYLGKRRDNLFAYAKSKGIDLNDPSVDDKLKIKTELDFNTEEETNPKSPYYDAGAKKGFDALHSAKSVREGVHDMGIYNERYGRNRAEEASQEIPHYNTAAGIERKIQLGQIKPTHGSKTEALAEASNNNEGKSNQPVIVNAPQTTTHHHHHGNRNDGNNDAGMGHVPPPEADRAGLDIGLYWGTTA